MYRSIYLLALILCMMFLGACTRYGLPGDPLPTDERPSIALLSPTNNNLLLQQGTTVGLTFKLNDNEALRVFRVVGRVFNQQDSIMGANFIVVDSVISGKTRTMTLNYTMPLGLPQYYKVKLTAFAIDSKGAFSSSIVTANVVFGPPFPPPYATEGPYNNARIYSKLASNGKWNYRFSGGLAASQCYTTNIPGQDIAETSTVASGFIRQLRSPNNFNNDSIFVVTDATRFNFDDATYTTIWQAYFSDPSPDTGTPTLNVGDIVVVRLANNTPVQHYALMRIKAVNDDSGDANDYMDFDFKYTY